MITLVRCEAYTRRNSPLLVLNRNIWWNSWQRMHDCIAVSVYWRSISEFAITWNSWQKCLPETFLDQSLQVRQLLQLNPWRYFRRPLRHSLGKFFTKSCTNIRSRQDVTCNMTQSTSSAGTTGWHDNLRLVGETLVVQLGFRHFAVDNPVEERRILSSEGVALRFVQFGLLGNWYIAQGHLHSSQPSKRGDFEKIRTLSKSSKTKAWGSNRPIRNLGKLFAPCAIQGNIWKR